MGDSEGDEVRVVLFDQGLEISLFLSESQNGELTSSLSMRRCLSSTSPAPSRPLA